MPSPPQSIYKSIFHALAIVVRSIVVVLSYVQVDIPNGRRLAAGAGRWRVGHVVEDGCEAGSIRNGVQLELSCGRGAGGRRRSQGDDTV